MDLNLIFTAISTVCAVIGTIELFISYRNKKQIIQSEKTVRSIRQEIEDYRINVTEKNNLIKLSMSINPIKQISNDFLKISFKSIPLPGDNKSELDYYNEFMTQINEILYDIPDEYIDIKELLIKIKNGFSNCLENKKTFDRLGQYSEYNYKIMGDYFQILIGKISAITSDLMF